MALTVVEKVILLQDVDVFAEVKTEQLALLAAIANEVHPTAGEHLYRENDPSDALYVVVDGLVRLHREGQEITTASEKDAFGTWALFDREPRVVTATVVRNAHLLRIGREDFYDLLADHVQVTQGVLETMVKRLRRLVHTLGRPPGTTPGGV